MNEQRPAELKAWWTRKLSIIWNILRVHLTKLNGLFSTLVPDLMEVTAKSNLAVQLGWPEFCNGRFRESQNGTRRYISAHIADTRRNKNVAAMALANKNARIGWALLVKDGISAPITLRQHMLPQRDGDGWVSRCWRPCSLIAILRSSSTDCTGNHEMMTR